MTTEVLTTYHEATTLEGLIESLKTALADAGDDRIAEGGESRVHESEVYVAPVHIDLLRERLTDGSYVYNLRLRAAA
jgi:hypothetical protein